MSNDSSDSPSGIPWNGWLGAAAGIFLFIVAQVVAVFILSVYPAASTRDWLVHSLAGQIVYLALANLLIFGGLWLFMRIYRAGWSSIGLSKPRLKDPLYSLGALPVYFVTLALSITLIKYFVPALDLDQQQDLGFNGTYHGVQLALIAVSLVVVPPLTEEIVFRGLIFTSLKKKTPIITAALVTSLLFAAGHLPEGGSGGLLYIAAIDTFILSLVLCYLRQKTGRLWAGIGLHALKNGIAFVSLFLVHVR
jgi:membrane protease YdiL (CAAX protease family)